MIFASSEDSDLPDHPPSLIRVIAVRMKKHWVLSYPLSALRRLWSAWADIGHWPILLFCLFVLKLNVPVSNFSVMSGRSHRFLGNNQYVWGVKCLAQGHNTAAVGFESPTSRSGVRHSEPPCSPLFCCDAAQIVLYAQRKQEELSL